MVTGITPQEASERLNTFQVISKGALSKILLAFLEISQRKTHHDSRIHDTQQH